MRWVLSTLVVLLLCNGTTSCVNANKNVSTISAVRCFDRCASDTSNSYEVFVPERVKPDQKLPLLVIIDPHGSGKTALEKFRSAADHFPAVLVASNLVKNNFAGFENALQVLIEDVRSKYPVGEVTFLSGFSGGARMAIGYAMNHPVNGLILSGALAGPDELRKVGCLVYSLSGTDDFNFMETAQYLFQESSIPKNLKIEFIHSIHSWPDSLTLADAFGFIQLACPEAGATSDFLLKNFGKQQSEKIAALRSQGELLNALLVARNMSTTTPFSNDKMFSDTYHSLKTSPEFSAQMNLLMQNLQHEFQVRQPYLEALQTKSTDWWKNELKTVENQIQNAPDPFTKDAYRRIKAFWGIACYSFCNQAVQQHDAKMLKQILPIYQLLEPENPDMLYFSAVPH